MCCLDQPLITIRSLTTLCDHSRSKTRLIAFMNLIIAKLEIIYTTLYNQVAVSEYHCQCRCTALTSIYKHGTGRGGRWRSACQLEQQHALSLCSVLCWLPLIASRNIGHLSIWDPIHRVVLTLLHTGLQILAR